MSDEEWTFFERFILAVRAPNGRKPTNHRLVLDGIFWIARTGAPWRDLPGEFGKWSSVYRQFRRWTLAGLWEDIMEALNQSGAVPSALQMIDIWVLAAVVLHWTVIVTVGLYCFIVFVMKGPAYVADRYDLPDEDAPR